MLAVIDSPVFPSTAHLGECVAWRGRSEAWGPLVSCSAVSLAPGGASALTACFICAGWTYGHGAKNLFQMGSRAHICIQRHERAVHSYVHGHAYTRAQTLVFTRMRSHIMLTYLNARVYARAMLVHMHIGMHTEAYVHGSHIHSGPQWLERGQRKCSAGL